MNTPTIREALQRLTYWARNMVGRTECTGDHPIADAERALAAHPQDETRLVLMAPNDGYSELADACARYMRALDAIANGFSNPALLAKAALSGQVAIPLAQPTQQAAPAQQEVAVTDEMVNRFLCWQLPKGFAPDCGVSFDGRKDDEWNKNKAWPIGTNLFTAEQARQMLEHALGVKK